MVMATTARFEYQYTLVPKGETLASADERRMERIIDVYDPSYADEKEARRALKQENRVDKYALRKYWDVVRLDVKFANKPWNSWADFEDDMQTLDDDVLFVKTRSMNGMQAAFISTTDGAEEEIADKIKDYYSILKPIVEPGHITVCPDAPLVELEEEFPK